MVETEESEENNVATDNGTNDIEQGVMNRRFSVRIQNQAKNDQGKEKKGLTKKIGENSARKRSKNKVDEQGTGSQRIGLRLRNQHEASESSVHSAKGRRKNKMSSDHSNLVCEDLSNGLEAIPIPVFNEVDDAPTTPTGFTYITSNEVGNNVQVPPSNGYGCQCKGGSCTRSKPCSCVRLNNELPYTSVRKVGRLIKAKDIVFECGPSCGCAPVCYNRVSQKGIQYHLEVYRTPNKGWGVRTKDYIPFGAFVCELVGVLKRNEDLDNAINNEYITEIDCWQRIKGLGGRERRLSDEALTENIFNEKEEDNTREEPEFCIDSSCSGNVGRFINHSCEPNLFVQCILNSHYGLKQARLALYAGKYIRPHQELSYDYGYQLNSVVDENGNIKQMSCHCGEVTCRGRLY